MANINQIEIEGTVYDIEDTSALHKSGGTLTGDVTANPPAVGDSKVRNIKASTTDLTAGTSPLATGEIYCVYE